MDKKLAIGTTTFALLNVAVGLVVAALLDLVEAPALVRHAGTYLLAIPLALVVARRVGRLTRAAVFAASLFVVIATILAIVLILDGIARPAGGHVGWVGLFNTMSWRTTVADAAAMLLVPQIWLWLLDRLAANSSSKPTPLRGAA